MTRVWLSTLVVGLSVLSGRAVAVATGRGCARGQFPGPGSAPCTKQYHGSGHLSATPEPGPFALPTPNPSGQLWPGCTCPIPMPGLVGSRGTPPPSPVFNVAKLSPGEVEVLTVDVRVANRVRCENASIAEDVAKMLKIPVKRITVTPWSWTLPNPPQSNYLAFVQEDHDRCDCQSDSGKIMQGQGFKSATLNGASAGWMLAPDTSVMTVSQYDALHPSASSTSSTASTAGQTQASASSPVAEEPPSSRVQMLTRDPCLVYLLREMTPHFKKRVAFLLGVPEDKVMIDPPPVKGTVGLLQLDTKLNSETEVRQVPVLAVRQCNLAALGEMEEHLSLVAKVASPAPAAATLLAPSPAAYPVFTVAGSNDTNATNATNVTQQVVSLVMKLENMNYDLLAESWSLVSSFTSVLKAALGEAGHLPAEAVKMALYPGSVVIEASLTAPPGTAPEAVLAFLNGTVCNSTVNHLNMMTALDPVMTGPLDCSVVSMTLEDPPAEPDEANRAWISFWSIVVLPPFAEDAAWRLLSMVNKPMTELSKLLPLTLARIPGLKYRGLKEPNAAIESANETRLPPPLDKAVGFAVPDPYAEEARIETEMRRMQREKHSKALMVKEKNAMNMMKAQSALDGAKNEETTIKEANANFINAARVHASEMRAPDALEGPDIVPYGILQDPVLGDESPYPWRDQEPPVHKYTMGLVQDTSSQQRLRPLGKAKLRRKVV